MILGYVILFIFGCIYIYLCTFRPVTAIYLVLTVKFSLDLLAQNTTNPSLFHAISAAFILMGCIIIIFRSPLAIHNKRLQIVLVLLIASNLVSGIWGILNSKYLFFEIVHSPIRTPHVITWIGKVSAIILPLLVGMKLLKTDLQLPRMLVAIIIGTLPVCLIGFAEVIAVLYENASNLILFHWSSGWRISGGFHGPGTLGLTMFVGICSTYYLLFFNHLTKRLYKYLLILYLVAAYIVMTCTITRISWVSLLFFCCTLLLVSKPQLRNPAILTILIIMINPVMWSRFNKEVSFVIQKNNAQETTVDIDKLGSGRVWLWKDALQHFTHLDPISQTIGSGGYYGSHNQYIAWLLRNGIVGLLIWIYFMMIILRYLSKSSLPDLSFIFALTITIFAIVNLFSHPWDNFNISFIFWFLIGIYLRNERSSCEDHTT